uniref:Nam 11 n=1 Tax=Solanum tuberosum TaxID=4113 RepID=M1BU31_SOLTU
MAGATLPPGFRFHPTDDELVGYYLKRKTDGLEIEMEQFPGDGTYLHYEFPNVASWQPNDRIEVTSSSTSLSLRGEVELSGDLSSFGCVSPYSIHGSYTGLYDNSVMSYEGNEGWDQANLGDVNGLWSDEDNFQ